nr:hypothetical protein CCACVL1_30839 [Ipomoea batatas]
MRNSSTHIVVIKVEVLKLSQVPNLMRNNSTDEDYSTKVEVLKLCQVPNLWRYVSTKPIVAQVQEDQVGQITDGRRDWSIEVVTSDVETSEAGKRSKIEVVKSTREISIRKIDLRDSSTSIADNAPPITNICLGRNMGIFEAKFMHDPISFDAMGSSMVVEHQRFSHPQNGAGGGVKIPTIFPDNFVKDDSDEGNAPKSEFKLRSKEMREPWSKFIPKETEMSQHRKTLNSRPIGSFQLKSKKTKSDKSPMAGGIDPLKLFPAMLKRVRVGKEVKLRLDSDHESSEKDHESSEKDTNKLVFHLRRASASVVVDADAKKQADSTRKMMTAV